MHESTLLQNSYNPGREEGQVGASRLTKARDPSIRNAWGERKQRGPLKFRLEYLRLEKRWEMGADMEYVNLGRTGLKVSRICLGCMTYGTPATGKLLPGRHAWSLSEADSQPFLRQALDLGINFFDTANVYSSGESEAVLGRFLKANARREAVVIATKAQGVMREEPNGKGLSRKAILFELDQSLKRLETDYVDLYQTHRWDYETPIEETLEALHDVVKAGKVRYIGASSMYAWQFAQALYIADLRGWTRFVSMQNHYNLLYREEEREMMGLCRAEGIGVIPWSPLARGRLTRPWGAEPTTRSESDVFGKSLYSRTEEADHAVVDRLGEIAEMHGIPRAQVGLAWLLSKPGVTAPIVGATKPNHLEDAVAALSVRLTPEEIKALEEPYVPHPVLGFS
jgi:aryl-alcohol dehydrogenase-like predicted oxidoreductase